MRKFSSDTREPGAEWRLQVARALGDVKNPAFRSMLVPLMYDANLDVAKAAIDSAGTLGAGDFLFVPPLVSLLRNRRLKSAARTVLVGYGEAVIAPLAYFMRDREEDIWIRRHVPSTLALLPFPASIDALTAALDDSDGFLRFKATMALDQLRRAASGARDRSEDRLAAHQRRSGPGVQRADPALQPVRRRRPRHGSACWRGS